MHGAGVYRARTRNIRPVVPDHGLGGVVSLLGLVRARRDVPHAAAAGAGRAPAGLLLARRAHAATALPGAGQLHHRHAHC